MAAGKPVVACVDEESDLWRLIEQVGCGICVRAGDVGALARALDRLQVEGCGDMGERGRRYVERYQTRGVVGEAYDLLLAQLQARRRAPVVRAPGTSSAVVDGNTAADSVVRSYRAREPARR
jgi:hypothetical protein